MDNDTSTIKCVKCGGPLIVSTIINSEINEKGHLVNSISDTEIECILCTYADPEQIKYVLKLYRSFLAL
jgi:hypothetical protein